MYRQPTTSEPTTRAFLSRLAAIPPFPSGPANCLACLRNALAAFAVDNSAALQRAGRCVARATAIDLPDGCARA